MSMTGTRPGPADRVTAAEPVRVTPVWLRAVGLVMMMAVFMIGPLSGIRHATWGWRTFVEVLGLVVLFGLLVVFGLGDRVGVGGYGRMWAMLTVVIVLGVALPLIGGPGWIGTTAVAATMTGRFLRPRPAIAVVGLLSAYTLALPFLLGADHGLVVFALLPVAAAVFPYQTQRRIRIIQELRETRAELARAAVVEERLRIARDLHDLLGHSLSVITLKSELAGRMVDADPARARTEMAEVEAVARRSLSEVREAVTAYRRPTLDGELAAARAALTSADVAVCVEPWPGGDLPAEVDALLAWAVREGTTNVLRHSGAHACTIRLTGDERVVLELSDDGSGRGTPETLGSGLSGLSERAGQLGGALTAERPPGGGFLLRVTVPVRVGDVRRGER